MKDSPIKANQRRSSDIYAIIDNDITPCGCPYVRYPRVPTMCTAGASTVTRGCVNLPVCSMYAVVLIGKAKCIL